MIDFMASVKNVLEEQGKTFQDLFKDRVVSENTFYKYRQRFPSLSTITKIANYLEVSLDYLFEFTFENKFVPYTTPGLNFYNNVMSFLKKRNVSGRKFCRELNCSRNNLNFWKNGTEPTVQTVLEVAKYFNCLVDDLLLE